MTQKARVRPRRENVPIFILHVHHAVAVIPSGPSARSREPLPRHRLDGIPPQLDNLHLRHSAILQRIRIVASDVPRLCDSIFGHTRRVMTRTDAGRFAANWIDAWNRLDIEAVLATFADRVAFTSPTALSTVGVGTVHGKQELRAYWRAALARITALRFSLERTVWDAETRELAIIYVSEVNGAAKRVSENFRFNQDGRVEAAEVFHGVGAA